MPSFKTPDTIQNILWGLFLIYYFAAKYFVGGFTGFSWPYLFSVLVLVILTAVVPFYVARAAAGRTAGMVRLLVRLILPTVLTAGGLSLYFVIFIQPNYETIKLPAIIHRAIMPGVMISLILLIGTALRHRFAAKKAGH